MHPFKCILEHLKKQSIQNEIMSTTRQEASNALGVFEYIQRLLNIAMFMNLEDSAPNKVHETGSLHIPELKIWPVSFIF